MKRFRFIICLVLCILVSVTAIDSIALKQPENESDSSTVKNDRGAALSGNVEVILDHDHDTSHYSYYTVTIHYTSTIPIYRIKLWHIYVKSVSLMDSTVYYDQSLTRSGLNSTEEYFELSTFLVLPKTVTSVRVTIPSGYIEDYNSNQCGVDFYDTFTLN